MVRALEQQPEVALQLAVVGGEDDVDVVDPAPCLDGGQDAAQGLVDELALDGVAGIDLTHLVGGQRGRHPLGGGLVVRDERAVVPEPPVPRLGVEDALAFGGVLGVARGQVDVAPVDAAHLRLRWIPRVVGVGEAHPAEPVVVGVEGVEPADRPVGHPVGVVPALVDGVHVDLRCAGLATTCGVDLEGVVEDRVEAADGLGVLGGEPAGVVGGAQRAVRGELEVLEAAVHAAGRAGVGAHGVLGEPLERVEEGLEVGLADERRAVARRRGAPRRPRARRRAAGRRSSRRHGWSGTGR